MRCGRPSPTATADHQLTSYLQRAQQPVAATRVAAAAAVLNSATSATASPNSFIFILTSPINVERTIRSSTMTLRPRVDLNVKGLDLQVNFKVFY